MESVPERVGPYRVLGVLGKGAFSIVYRAQHQQTMVEVALKQIPKSNIKCQRDFELLQREVALMKQVDHPFIASFYEVIEDKTHFYLSIELVDGGNLLDYINSRRGLSEDQARNIFYQIMMVLDYLHNTKKVCHRDIKAENVLLTQGDNPTIRIVDFGLSKSFSTQNPFMDTTCGSPAYVAPEIVQEQPYTAAADIWSAGVLLYAMVCGRLPFMDDNLNQLLDMICTQQPRFPRNLTPPVKSMLTKLLTKDPKMRISIEQVFKDGWVKDGAAFNAEFLQCMRIMDVQELDDDVCAELTTMGMNSEGLRAELAERKVNARTSIYKQLRRQRVNDDIRLWTDSGPRSVITMARSQVPSVHPRVPSSTGPRQSQFMAAKPK